MVICYIHDQQISALVILLNHDDQTELVVQPQRSFSFPVAGQSLETKSFQPVQIPLIPRGSDDRHDFKERIDDLA